MAFSFVFAGPVTDPWALQEKTALKWATQSMCYMGYKHKPYNKKN